MQSSPFPLKRHAAHEDKAASAAGNPAPATSANQGFIEALTKRKELAFIICVGGIYVSYMLFGIYQEELGTLRFGADHQKFNNTPFLLFSQALANCISAWLIISIGKEKSDSTPLASYFLISLTYIGAMYTSNLAIQYVNYPTMVLAKSCKPIPVMLMGFFVNNHKQDRLKYISVLLITIGISIFTLQKGGKKHGGSSDEDDESSTFGLILLVISLALDGVTGPVQEKIIKQHNPSPNHMILFTNIWACIVMGAVLIVTGDGMRGLLFCAEHRDVIFPIVMFSVLSAVGQNFIYLTLFVFGSLMCSITTTTRKFFTILLSVLWFGHTMVPMQWVGVAVVFAGLALDMFNSYFMKSKKKHH